MFDLRLYNQLAGDGGNMFFSPYSIQVALGMCSAGSANNRSDTRKCMANLLGVDESQESQSQYFGDLVADVVGDESSIGGSEGGLHVSKDGGKTWKDTPATLGPKSSRPYTLTTANALWMHNSFQANPEYVALIERVFRGTLNKDADGKPVVVDYVNDPDGAVGNINSWCNKNTNGKIPTIVSRDLITSITRLILTNAIYFKGTWRVQFDAEMTQDRDFHLIGGGVDQMPMMRHEEPQKFPFYEEPGLKVCDFPYKGDLVMTVVLPETANAFNIAEKRLLGGSDNTELARLTMGLRPKSKVWVMYPKFKVSTEYRLGQKLIDMGGGLAFSDDADFSGIGEDPDGVTLKISQVVHKAFVDVNEEGTEAAAATAVLMSRCLGASFEETKEFICDRPFIYFIRKPTTGNVSFMGRLIQKP